MLKLLIVLAICLQIYLFEVININNCINGTHFTSKCEYNINFYNIGSKNLDCILNFTSSNPTVKFINNWIKAKKEDDNECPIINLNIITVTDGKTKDNKLSTTCGGEIEKLERKFSNFSSFVIKLDTKGLNDQDSSVNMNLMIDGECRENREIVKRRNFIWIIIFIIIWTILSVILSILLIVRRRSRKQRQTNKFVSEEIENQSKASKTFASNTHGGILQAHCLKSKYSSQLRLQLFNESLDRLNSDTSLKTKYSDFYPTYTYPEKMQQHQVLMTHLFKEKPDYDPSEDSGFQQLCDSLDRLNSDTSSETKSSDVNTNIPIYPFQVLRCVIKENSDDDPSEDSERIDAKPEKTEITS